MSMFVNDPLPGGGIIKKMKKELNSRRSVTLPVVPNSYSDSSGSPTFLEIKNLVENNNTVILEAEPESESEDGNTDVYYLRCVVKNDDGEIIGFEFRTLINQYTYTNKGLSIWNDEDYWCVEANVQVPTRYDLLKDKVFELSVPFRSDFTIRLEDVYSNLTTSNFPSEVNTMAIITDDTGTPPDRIKYDSHVYHLSEIVTDQYAVYARFDGSCYEQIISYVLNSQALSGSVSKILFYKVDSHTYYNLEEEWDSNNDPEVIEVHLPKNCDFRHFDSAILNISLGTRTQRDVSTVTLYYDFMPEGPDSTNIIIHPQVSIPSEDTNLVLMLIHTDDGFVCTPISTYCI